MASPALEDPFLMDLHEVAAAAATASAATHGAAAASSAIPDSRAAPSVDVTRHNFEVTAELVTGGGAMSYEGKTGWAVSPGGWRA